MYAADQPLRPIPVGGSLYGEGQLQRPEHGSRTGSFERDDDHDGGYNH